MIDTIMINDSIPRIIITSPDSNSTYPAFALVVTNASVINLGNQTINYLNIYLERSLMASPRSNYCSDTIYPLPGWLSYRFYCYGNIDQWR